MAKNSKFSEGLMIVLVLLLLATNVCWYLAVRSFEDSTNTKINNLTQAVDKVSK